LEPESGAAVFIGSKTEMALLKFAQNIGWPNYKDICDAASIIQMIPFSRDRMGCVVQLPHGVYSLFIEGAGEILSQKRTYHVVIHCNGANEVPGGIAPQLQVLA
jgi:Ca2+-transporting ATPase